MVSLKKDLVLNVCSYKYVKVCSFEVKQNKINLSSERFYDCPCKYCANYSYK